MDIEELKRKCADFPEINMSNFDLDDVAALNGWGIEVVLMLPAILAKLEAQDRVIAEARKIGPQRDFIALFTALEDFDKETAMKLEPVAWALYWKEGDLCDIVTAQRLADAWLKRMDDATITPRPHIAPLYATPEGYVVVPVDLVKEARRIVARAYADGNSASIRHYNCMTALDRLADWKEGEECILPDEPNQAMIAAKEQQ